MTISENELEANILLNIKGCAGDAALLLGLDMSQDSPKIIITAINTFLLKWQKGEQALLNDEGDLSNTLGSLWGEQLVKEFQWHWAGVTFRERNNTKAIGVVSPDSSLAVYPIHFIYGCLKYKAPVTVLLAYNFLLEGSGMPAIAPGGYQNMMDYVHHIVPES